MGHDIPFPKEPYSARVGEILVFTDGEYTDYGMLGMARVLKDFDTRQSLRSYIAVHPEQDIHPDGSWRSGGGIVHGQFMAWLVEQGCIEFMEYRQCYIYTHPTSFHPSRYQFRAVLSKLDECKWTDDK